MNRRERPIPVDEMWLPLGTVIGADRMCRVPLSAAAVIAAAVNRVVEMEGVGEGNRWQALEYIAADFLACYGTCQRGRG